MPPDIEVRSCDVDFDVDVKVDRTAFFGQRFAWLIFVVSLATFAVHELGDADLLVPALVAVLAGIVLLVVVDKNTATRIQVKDEVLTISGFPGRQTFRLQDVASVEAVRFYNRYGPSLQLEDHETGRVVSLFTGPANVVSWLAFELDRRARAVAPDRERTGIEIQTSADELIVVTQSRRWLPTWLVWIAGLYVMLFALAKGLAAGIVMILFFGGALTLVTALFHAWMYRGGDCHLAVTPRSFRYRRRKHVVERDELPAGLTLRGGDLAALASYEGILVAHAFPLLPPSRREAVAEAIEAFVATNGRRPSEMTELDWTDDAPAEAVVSAASQAAR